MIRKYSDPLGFRSVFDTETGSYLRSGLNGTDEDPFMSSYPQLLDIGIMGK